MHYLQQNNNLFNKYLKKKEGFLWPSFFCINNDEVNDSLAYYIMYIDVLI